jgi:4-deoxy-L-threo-5-hexosulose-uronate ketol-isomerase
MIWSRSELAARAVEAADDPKISARDPKVTTACQLGVGHIRFHGGFVWNTMCKMEADLYFDMGPAQRAFHIMDRPDQTCHLVRATEQAVISPLRSIHCGAQTGRDGFASAMADDDADCRDVAMAEKEDLR